CRAGWGGFVRGGGGAWERSLRGSKGPRTSRRSPLSLPRRRGPIGWRPMPWPRRSAMASLAETQVRLYRALLTGDGRSMAPLLVGVHRSRARFAIHMRNYEASLVAALTGKFPACAWLVGERFIAQAAREFVHRQPPTAPCIAEYGADFPRSLADLPAAC